MSVIFYKKSSCGSIAILSLWVIMILAFLAVGLGQSVRQKIAVREHLFAKSEVRTTGESAVKKLISDIQESPMHLGDVATGNEWYAGLLGKPQSIGIGEGLGSLTIRDENSKINLNRADAYVLANLFYFIASLDTNKANELANAVVDFRDKDDFVTGEFGGGSEKGTYQQAGLNYGPKNSDFELIEELLLVKGMTKEIYSLVRNYITIYGNGRVNINTCQKETLAVLGLLPELAEKIVSVREGQGLKTRAPEGYVFKDLSRIWADLLFFYPLTEEEKVSLAHAVAQNELCTVSDHFRIDGRCKMIHRNFSSRFVCIYGVREGIKYWAET